MSVALLAALLAGMLLINVAVAWTLARRDRGPGDAPDAEGRPPDDDRTGFDAVLARRGARNRSTDGDDASAHASTDGRSPSPDPSADDPPPLETDDETVVCGNCGARNRSGYRYCRWCVRSALVDDGRSRAEDVNASRRPL
jgi:hypothetical protein